MLAVHSFVGVFLFVVAGANHTDSSGVQQAREDVDRELRRIASRIPPPDLAIDFSPLASQSFLLEDAAFELDGQPLHGPSLEELKTAVGAQRLFGGNVSAGRHELTVRLVYRATSGLLSYVTGYHFKLAQKAIVETRRGLRADLHVRAVVDSKQDWRNRLSIEIEHQTEMTATLDDGDLPPIHRPGTPAKSGVAATVPDTLPSLESASPKVRSAKYGTARPPRSAALLPRAPTEKQPGALATLARLTGDTPPVTLAQALSPAPEPSAPTPVPEPPKAQDQPVPPAIPAAMTALERIPARARALVTGAGIILLGALVGTWVAWRRRSAARPPRPPQKS